MRGDVGTLGQNYEITIEQVVEDAHRGYHHFVRQRWSRGERRTEWVYASAREYAMLVVRRRFRSIERVQRNRDRVEASEIGGEG